MIKPVIVLHILNRLLTIFLTKVNVKIGHIHPFGIQETFKQQVKSQRINVRNRQAPCHHRSGPRTPARSHRYTVRFGPLNKIGHNQKITGEAHLLNHAQLIFHTLAIFFAFFVRSPFHAHLKAFVGHVSQHLSRCFAVAIIQRESRLFLFRHKSTPLGNHDRVLQGFG